MKCSWAETVKKTCHNNFKIKAYPEDGVEHRMVAVRTIEILIQMECCVSFYTIIQRKFVLRWIKRNNSKTY